MSDKTISIDHGIGKDICVEDRYMKPTTEYPDGSWLHTVDGKVEVATGYYATIHPDKPSPYFHGGPPFVVIDTADWAARQKEILRRVNKGESLALGGGTAYIGNQRTTSLPINGLLRYCAIKIESENRGTEYYKITETGKEILKRLEAARRI